MLIWVMRILLPSTLSRLRVRCILLQILIANGVQCLVLARMQMHPRHSRLREFAILRSLHGFLPAVGAKTPLHTILDAGFLQIVAFGFGEVEEVLVHCCGDGVAAAVVVASSAVSITIEASGRVV